MDVQFSPANEGADAFIAVGLVNDAGPTLISSGADEAATHNNNVFYQYPIAVAYTGEGRSTVMVIPSINFIINNTPTTEVVSDHWEDREKDVETLIGDEAFYVIDHIGGSSQNSLGFFLPSNSGGKLFIKWYQEDIDEHIAATESTTSPFLQTHDSTYTTGFITSVDFNLTASGSDAFGFTTAMNTYAVSANSRFTGYPFSDETDNYDGTSGTASDNTYLNPSAYPLYPNNITGPWLLLFPKLFSGSDQDKVQLNIFIYDPTTNTARRRS